MSLKLALAATTGTLLCVATVIVLLNNNPTSTGGTEITSNTPTTHLEAIDNIPDSFFIVNRVEPNMCLGVWDLTSRNSEQVLRVNPCSESEYFQWKEFLVKEFVGDVKVKVKQAGRSLLSSGNDGKGEHTLKKYNLRVDLYSVHSEACITGTNNGNYVSTWEWPKGGSAPCNKRNSLLPVKSDIYTFNHLPSFTLTNEQGQCLNILEGTPFAAGANSWNNGRYATYGQCTVPDDTNQWVFSMNPMVTHKKKNPIEIMLSAIECSGAIFTAAGACTAGEMATLGAATLLCIGADLIVPAVCGGLFKELIFPE